MSSKDPRDALALLVRIPCMEDNVDSLCEEITRLKLERYDLKQKLADYEEGLRFYANIANWQQDDMDIQDFTILPADREKMEKMNPSTGNYIVGGKTARETLKKWGKE